MIKSSFAPAGKGRASRLIGAGITASFPPFLKLPPVS